MKVWESILHGLQIYPFSPELLKDVVEVGNYYTTSNKLRRILDDCCYKYVPFPYSFMIFFKGCHGLIRQKFQDNNIATRKILKWFLTRVNKHKLIAFLREDVDH